MLHKISLLVFLLLTGGNVLGKDCLFTLSGYILDEHDKSGLDYSTVYIDELKTGTVADSNGYYELKGLCEGNYTIIVEHLGCTPDTITLKISQSVSKNFYLEHHAEELAELVTIASRSDKDNAQTSTVIDNKTLNRLEGKDLGSILATVSGVHQLKTGTTISKPVIHGLYGDRISIISNGVKLETQDWGTEHAPEIDPFTASTIKVIKGAGSLEYGTDAMGGMVLMQPAILQKYKHLKTKVSLIGQTNGHAITSSAYLEQGFQRQIAYFIQGTYKRSGDQQAPDYNLTNTGLQEGNLSAGFGILRKGWDINAYYSLFNQEVAILKSAHIGNLTDLLNAIESDRPLITEPFTYALQSPKQKINHHLSKINIRKTFSGQRELDITYSLQYNKRREFDIRRGGRSDIPALDMHLLSNNILASYKRIKRFRRKSFYADGKSGFNFLAKHNSNNPETGIRPLIPDYYQYGIGFFDMEKITLGQFILEAGARYDYTRFSAYKFDKSNVLLKPVFNYHTYAFSVGGSWKNTGNHIQLQSNISYSSRFPNASELFSEGLHHGIAALEFGNQDLKPEKGIKWISTITAQYRKYVQAEATFYVSTINDYIYLAPLPEPVLTIRGAFPSFQYYQTNARLIGTDISISSEPFSFLSLSLRGSLVRGKNTNSDDHLIYMPADRISASFDVHRDFRKIKNAHIGMSLLHSFKQTRIPSDIPDYKAVPDAYTLLNAETGFDYAASEKHLLSFSVSGENITNKAYRDYLNRFRYYSDEPGWNLTFRIKYSFN